MQIQYKKQGVSMAQMPVMMGTGFAFTVLMAFLAAYLLRLALPALPTYFARVGFVFSVGVFTAAGRLSDVIWFHHYWAFELGQMLFVVISWLLSGVVLAAIIRPTGQSGLAATPQHSSLAA